MHLVQEVELGLSDRDSFRIVLMPAPKGGYHDIAAFDLALQLAIFALKVFHGCTEHFAIRESPSSG